MEEASEKLGLIATYFADFSDRQLQQFAAMESLYRDWNSKINVISRKDEDSLYEKHVLHSLSIAAVFTMQPGTQVLDLGTGGGFPGIPLAVFYPEVEFVLADSIGKKIRVVQAVAEALELANVTTINSRAEDIKFRKFDAVVSRAVAPLADLWRWSRPLLQSKPRFAVDDPAQVQPHGLICLKGGDLAAEIAASGRRPRLMEISGIFDRPFFHEKYVVYCPYP